MEITDSQLVRIIFLLSFAAAGKELADKGRDAAYDLIKELSNQE